MDATDTTAVTVPMPLWKQYSLLKLVKKALAADFSVVVWNCYDLQMFVQELYG